MLIKNCCLPKTLFTVNYKAYKIDELDYIT